MAEFGQVLRKRWKLVTATTLACIGLGVAFLAVTKPLYAASTLIFVDPRNRASFMIEGTGSGAGFDSNLVDSQIVLILSDTVLRRVIEQEKLLDDSELTKGKGEPQANVLENLKKAMKVKRPERTYVVEVELRTTSPEKSARLANAVARAYLSDGADSKSETARRESTWLETHLVSLQSRLREAENRVEAFKAENKLVSVGVENKLVEEQRLTELNRSMIEAQKRTTEARATLDQVEQIRKSGKLPDTTVDALKSGVIERLRTQMAEILRLEANSRSTLGPRHPASVEIREQLVQTRRQLNEELNRIADGARNAYGVAKANEAALEKQVDGLKGKTTSNNQTMVRLRDLERAVEAQKAVYQKFLSDKEQIARLTVDTPAGRIIAPATVPTSKAFPNKILILGLSIITGLFGGVALALTVETLQRSRRPKPAAPAFVPHTYEERARHDEDDEPDMPPPDHEAAVAPAYQAETEPAFATPGKTRRTKSYPQPVIAPAPPPAILPPPRVLAMLPRVQSSQNLRWVSARSAPVRAQGEVALDLVRRRPDCPYSLTVFGLATQLIAMIGPARPVTLLITGWQAGSGSTTLAGNLGWALAARQRRLLLIDANPDRCSLTSTLPTLERPVSVVLSGAMQPVLPASGAGANGPFLLPYGGVAGGRRSESGADCDIVLIDGPQIGSAQLESTELDQHVDGVIVTLPIGLSPHDPQVRHVLSQHFGSLLIGVVAQAA